MYYQGFIQDFEIGEGAALAGLHQGGPGARPLPPGTFGNKDALRLILRHSRGTPSHSVNVEMLCTCIIRQISFWL